MIFYVSIYVFYDFFMIFFMRFCFNCLIFLCFLFFERFFLDSIHFEKTKTFQFVGCLLLNFLLHLSCSYYYCFNVFLFCPVSKLSCFSVYFYYKLLKLLKCDLYGWPNTGLRDNNIVI